ncbi:hypothetical protein ACFLRF_02340, partial [Candidatus Altiarchaeota archaeon]
MVVDFRRFFIACMMVLVVVGSISRCPRNLEPLVRNSDIYYFQGVYEDLFVSGVGLGGWSLQAAPGFMPDMLLFFPIRGVLGDYISSMIVFQLLVILIFFGLLTMISRSLGVDSVSSVEVSLMTVLGVMIMDNAWDCSIFRFIMIPGYHVGSVILGLILWLIGFGILSGGGKRLHYISFFTVSLIGAISDPIIIPQFILPTVISLIVFYLLGLARSKTVIGLSIICLLALALHQLSYKLFEEYSIFMSRPQSYVSASITLGHMVSELLGFLAGAGQEYCSIATHVLAF